MTIDTGGRPFGEPIMRLDKGEKMYKIFRFIPKQKQDNYFEYRILTKLKKDGNLAMASYSYKVIKGQIYKGNVMRSDSVPPKKMDSIVKGMLKTVNRQLPSSLEIIDLTKYKTIEEQVQQLVDLDKVHTQYMD